ncbi:MULTISPECIES: helix-turn-helix domain-containing protein [unclassified Cupriavidus]|uniref:helix-turn-helix domain-containing protein n=1 Tax=Cupriavidus sp. H19C3 TaxID=3241603 RepID=UPI003BF919A0
MTSFLAQLRGLRDRRAISLTTLAQLVGMAPPNLSTALSGRTDVRASTLDALASALDAEWVLVPRNQVPAVRRLLEGKESGPDREAPTSVDLLLGSDS